MIHQQDLTELKRMMTNLYDEDKACVVRIIRGISALELENRQLKSQVKALSTPVDAAAIPKE